MFDTVKSTEIQEMLKTQNNSAKIQALEVVLGNSWMKEIRTRALNQEKINLYIKQTPSPLSKTPSPKTASP